MYMHMCAHMCVHMRLHMHLHAHKPICIHMHVHLHTPMQYALAYIWHEFTHARAHTHTHDANPFLQPTNECKFGCALTQTLLKACHIRSDNTMHFYLVAAPHLGVVRCHFIPSRCALSNPVGCAPGAMARGMLTQFGYWVLGTTLWRHAIRTLELR